MTKSFRPKRTQKNNGVSSRTCHVTWAQRALPNVCLCALIAGCLFTPHSLMTLVYWGHPSPKRTHNHTAKVETISSNSYHDLRGLHVSIFFLTKGSASVLAPFDSSCASSRHINSLRNFNLCTFMHFRHSAGY